MAVKLSPFFSSIGEMAQRLDQAGADGLVLFNRLLQPDIDCETFTPAPDVPLSAAAEIRLPLTWIALLRHGPEYADVLLDGLRDWMLRKGFSTLDEVRGMLAVHDDRSARERGDYVSALRDANSGAYGIY